MPLRETRRFKTKGFAVSFGDIMLPLVGLVAVVLLFIAGKFFFFSGPHLVNDPAPVIETPRRGAPPSRKPEGPIAQAGEKKDVVQRIDLSSPRPSSETPVGNNPSSAPVGAKDTPAGLDVMAVPYNGTTPPKSDPVQTTLPVQDSRKIPPQPVGQLKGQPQPRAESATSEKKSSTPEPVKLSTPPPAPKPDTSKWMVQLGAFSTLAAAQSFAEQVTKAGYVPMVISGNPLHRVLVQAGASKDDALKLATRMNESGFRGFVVPPRP